MYMNSVSLENAGSAKYTCDMVVDKIGESILSIMDNNIHVSNMLCDLYNNNNQYCSVF